MQVPQILASVGLGHPLTRFAVTTAVVGSSLVMLQPDLMFEGDAPRPWSLVVGDDESLPIQSTPTPWWLVAISAGALSAMFL